MSAPKVWAWGATSRARLATCHPKLIAVTNRALELSMVDMTVVCGYRSPVEQAALYAQGRTEPGNIVTYVDGTRRKSRHNYKPALAVDVVPFVQGCGPIWGVKNHPEAEMLFRHVENAMKRAAAELGVGIEWGGEKWAPSFIDRPHWQLKGAPSRLLRGVAV